MLYTKIKELVEKLQIPLVLGPQTYGPFQDEENKKYAKKVIAAPQGLNDTHSLRAKEMNIEIRA